MSDTALLGAARELRSLIEREADTIEREGTMSAPVVQGLEDAGLFRLLVPRALGGHEADAATVVEVCAELSFADGAVGWAFAQNITVGGALAYLDPEVGRRLAELRTGAGHFAPLGVAREAEGGWRISGRYRFASGSGHACYIGGTAMKLGEGGEVLGGLNAAIGFLIPIERAVVKRDWDVMGLRGTGSYDYDIPEQLVEEGATFPAFVPRIVTGGPLYGIGVVGLGTVGSVGWALGTAERAMFEIAEIGKAGRGRLGQEPMREQPTFQRDFGHHTSALRVARLAATRAFDPIVEAMLRGHSAAEIHGRISQMRADTSYVVRVAKEAATFAWESSGSTGIRNPSRLQRCFRDLCVGAGHLAFDDRNYRELARPILGLEPAPF